MLVLIIIGLLGLIFGLSLILYFTSKDVIGEPRGYAELDAGSCDKATHKQMIKDQKRLPNSYNRQKQSRLYCYTKDKYLQQLSGDSEFWLSMYSGRQYVYKLVLDSTQTKD